MSFRDQFVKRKKGKKIQIHDNGISHLSKKNWHMYLGCGWPFLVLKSFKLQAFHKSHLLKLRVAPSETAMTDVRREVFFFCIYFWFLQSLLEEVVKYIVFTFATALHISLSLWAIYGNCQLTCSFQRLLLIFKHLSLSTVLFIQFHAYMVLILLTNMYIGIRIFQKIKAFFLSF